MSKTFEECSKEVGLDNSKITPPDQKKVWYAYEGGKAIKCDTQAEAKKHKLYEVVLDADSKAEIQKFWEDRKALEQKAVVSFRDSLRAEYSAMSTELFDLCYEAAQEWGRSTDYDEIPNNLEKFTKFAQRAIKIRK